MEKRELYLQEQLHAFLIGELSEHQRQSFLKEVSSDPEMADELAFSQSLIRVLRHPETASVALTIKHVIEQEGFPPPVEQVPFWKSPWSWVGGLLLLGMFAMGIYITVVQKEWPLSPSQRLARAAIRPLENVFFLEHDSLQVLQKAMEAYDAGQYARASRLLEAYLKDNNDSAARLFLGVCYLLDQRPEQAISTLATAAQSQEVPVQEAALWYLALAYLENNQPVMAKQILEAISVESIYREEAKALLEKMD